MFPEIASEDFPANPELAEGNSSDTPKPQLMTKLMYARMKTEMLDKVKSIRGRIGDLEVELQKLRVEKRKAEEEIPREKAKYERDVKAEKAKWAKAKEQLEMELKDFTAGVDERLEKKIEKAKRDNVQELKDADNERSAKTTQITLEKAKWDQASVTSAQVHAAKMRKQHEKHALRIEKEEKQMAREEDVQAVYVQEEREANATVVRDEAKIKSDGLKSIEHLQIESAKARSDFLLATNKTISARIAAARADLNQATEAARVKMHQENEKSTNKLVGDANTEIMEAQKSMNETNQRLASFQKAVNTARDVNINTSSTDFTSLQKVRADGIEERSKVTTEGEEKMEQWIAPQKALLHNLTGAELTKNTDLIKYSGFEAAEATATKINEAADNGASKLILELDSVEFVPFDSTVDMGVDGLASKQKALARIDHDALVMQQSLDDGRRISENVRLQKFLISQEEDELRAAKKDEDKMVARHVVENFENDWILHMRRQQKGPAARRLLDTDEKHVKAQQLQAERDVKVRARSDEMRAKSLLKDRENSERQEKVDARRDFEDERISESKAMMWEEVQEARVTERNITQKIFEEEKVLRELKSSRAAVQKRFEGANENRFHLLTSPGFTAQGTDPEVTRKSQFPLKWVDVANYTQKQGAFFRFSTARLRPLDKIELATLRVFKVDGPFGDIRVNLVMCNFSKSTLTGFDRDHYVQQVVSDPVDSPVSRIEFNWVDIKLHGDKIEDARNAGQDICLQVSGGSKFKELPPMHIYGEGDRKPYLQVRVKRAEIIAREKYLALWEMKPLGAKKRCVHNSTNKVLESFMVSPGAPATLETRAAKAMALCETWCRERDVCKFCNLVPLDPPTGFWEYKFTAQTVCSNTTHSMGLISTGDASMKMPVPNPPPPPPPPPPPIVETLSTDPMAAAQARLEAAQDALQRALDSGDPAAIAAARAALANTETALATVETEPPTGAPTLPPTSSPTAPPTTPPTQKLPSIPELTPEETAEVERKVKKYKQETRKALTEEFKQRSQTRIREEVARKAPLALQAEIGEKMPDFFEQYKKQKKLGVMWGDDYNAALIVARRELQEELTPAVYARVQGEVKAEQEEIAKNDLETVLESKASIYRAMLVAKIIAGKVQQASSEVDLSPPIDMGDPAPEPIANLYRSFDKDPTVVLLDESDLHK
jgi:hypothetical protein